MKIIAIGFGILLVVLGLMASMTEVAIFGAVAILLGLLQGQWPHNNPLYGTIMMGILSIIAVIRELIVHGIGTLPIVIAVVSVVYAGLAVALIEDFWAGWKQFGHFLGDWVARIALTFFYFTVFVPFAIGVRLFGDPLQIKSMPSALWRPRTTGDQSLDDIQRQF